MEVPGSREGCRVNPGDRGIRSFVAVPLDSQLSGLIASSAGALRESGADVKWVEARNLHFTLKFLGEIPEPRISAAKRGIERALNGRSSFGISLKGIGVFPSSDSPRVVWIGVSDGAETLVDLAGAVESEMEREGFARDRRGFTPHLTLGRVRGSRGLGALKAAVEHLRDADFGAMRVDSVFLMMSRLSPGGPTYTAIDKWSLGH